MASDEQEVPAPVRLRLQRQQQQQMQQQSDSMGEVVPIVFEPDLETRVGWAQCPRLSPPFEQDLWGEPTALFLQIRWNRTESMRQNLGNGLSCRQVLKGLAEMRLHCAEMHPPIERFWVSHEIGLAKNKIWVEVHKRNEVKYWWQHRRSALLRASRPAAMPVFQRLPTSVSGRRL